MTYPKNRAENIGFRGRIFTSPDLVKAWAKEEAYKDVLFFFNVFLWTYGMDAEKGGTIKYDLPFITWAFQDEYIRQIVGEIERGENSFTDKSRDMGVSWMVLGVFLWFWLTQPGSNFRIGSRKEEYVDKSGDMDTLFEKLRFMLDRLPGWMLPKGFDQKKHRPYMKIINPENGNALIGEATNKDFARGGRQRAVLYDEFQAWDMAEEAWTSASDATQCKIVVGTPDGAGNKFAELNRSETVKNKHHLHWWVHPVKSKTSEEHLKRVKKGLIFDIVGNYKVQLKKVEGSCYVDQHGKLRSQWYDEQHERRDKEDVASNIDIDYLTTGRPIFDTVKCDFNLRNALPGERGDLMWKVRPIFDSSTGICINQSQLEAEFIPNFNGLYEIWEKPEKSYDNGYVIGADTAEGLEQHDYDSAFCIKRTGVRPKFVASIHGHLKIHEYAEELAKFGVFYGAFINIERNNHGHGVILQVMKFYNKLWHQDLFTKGYAELTDKVGFGTTSMSKPVIIGTLGKAISEDGFDCSDAGFWRETLTFVEDDKKMEAQGKSKGQKCYDDRIMAGAIGLWTHLNMPLPAAIRKPEEEYRFIGQMRNNAQQSLVGWTI